MTSNGIWWKYVTLCGYHSAWTTNTIYRRSLNLSMFQTHMYTTHKKRNHTGSQILRKSSTHTHKYTIIYEPIIQIIYTNCIWIRTPRIGPSVNRSKGWSTGSQEKITYRQKPSSGLQERIKSKSVLSSFVEFCENWQ